MLITKMKSKEEIEALAEGKVFLVICRGCREISFPEEESRELVRSFSGSGRLAGALLTDYVCNPDFLEQRLRGCMSEAEEADSILVLSCGVGVQTVADRFDDRKVAPVCDTIGLPGVQGVTPMELDCARCGTCFLNLTGGICPVTACSKSLLNGPCGGSKDGRCEVDPEQSCGWERIFKRLNTLGMTENQNVPPQFFDFSGIELRPGDGNDR